MNRIEELKKQLAQSRIDAAFIKSEPNVRYLTGFSGTSSSLVITQDEAYFLTDFRYLEQAEKELSGLPLEFLKIPLPEAAYHIRELAPGVKTIGFEKDSTSVSSFEALRSAVDCELLGIDDLLYGMRAVKQEDELKKMRMAAAITQEALGDLFSVMKAGMSETDVMAELLYRFNKKGAAPSFPPIIASGENGSLPHATPTGRTLRPGDLVTIDCGCIYEGYCSDITRTVAISGVEEREKLIYNTVKSAQEACLDALSAGKQSAELDAIARRIIDGAGFAGCFEHGLGHGVGVEIHEAPSLNKTAETVLRPGMVVTIEPGIYVAGMGGVRIEDMAIVKENGYENFYTLTKDLIII